MAKGVFTTKVTPTYDDLPETRYHFPSTYLNSARQVVNDWILYYEPRRIGPDPSASGGRQCYFATARVRNIASDPRIPDHYYAYVSDYLEFPRPVPFREGSSYYESGLRKTDGSTNKGLFRRAVRILPDSEYSLILRVAFSKVTILGEDEGRIEDNDLPLVAEPVADYRRPVISQVTNRPFRDQVFQRLVREAYDATCAMTGLRIINGGGRCEIEAAHIRPVAEQGPDSPRNGIALSRTAHWMFDRGLLSVEDNGQILVAKKLVAEPFKRMLNPEGFINLPDKRFLRPHSQFLRFHRENVFKG